MTSGHPKNRNCPFQGERGPLSQNQPSEKPKRSVGMRPVLVAVVRNTKNVAVAKHFQNKIFCDPLQAMIQMIIILADYSLNPTIMAP